MIKELKDDVEYEKGRTASVEVACTFLIEQLLEKEEIKNELIPLFRTILKNMGASKARDGFNDGIKVLIKGTR